MKNKIIEEIDFLIPIFNGENFIEKCYNSIKKNFPKNKIYFCNDCSTDRTSKILRNLLANDSNVTIINNKKNMGTWYCRNILINKSNNRFIWFIDIDDTISVFNINYLKKQLSNDPDFIIVKWENSIEKIKKTLKFKIRFLPWYIKKIIKFFKVSNIADFIYSPLLQYNSIDDNILSFSWCFSVNKIFNREFLLKNNFKFPHYYFEDLIIIYLILKSNNFYINTYIYYIIGENTDSKTRKLNKSSKIKKDLYLSYNHLLSILNEKDIEKNHIFFDNFKKVTFGE